jgi:hypothetical protein
VDSARRLQAAAEKKGDLASALKALSSLIALLELEERRPQTRPPKQEVHFRVTYEKRPPAYTDVLLLRQLAHFCQRSRDDTAVAYAGRLGARIRGRALPESLDRQLAAAGAPRLEGTA